MKLWKGMTWKLRVIISVFVSVTLIISILVGTTYQYFRNKLAATNEKIAMMSFQQAERDLGEIISNVERVLGTLSMESAVWDFAADSYEDDLEKSVATKNIVEYFDEILQMDPGILGLAMVSGDGRVVVSTAKRSGTGISEKSAVLIGLMEKSQENYPFVNWSDSKEVAVPADDPLHILVKRPVLIGIRAVGEFENTDEDSYIIASVSENEIENSYKTLAYNGSQVFLLDGSGRIISSTNKELLGTQFVFQDTYHNIEYNLPFKDWKLVNVIDKAVYGMEGKLIQQFSLFGGIIALFFIFVIIVIWSRKYVRPIQSLMEQMEQVGKEQFDIDKPKRVGWLELDDLNETFYHTVQKLKGYIQKLKEVEQEKAKEELRTLQYQINPHFLYNSLNSIRWLAMMTNSVKVADSLVTLSKIIMPILRNPGFTWKLKEELSFVENYVKMMQIRYGSYVEYSVECPEELYEEDFPRFILQPVVENCFVHGSNDIENKEISLVVEKNDGFLVAVRNSDAVIEPEKVNRINEALRNGEEFGKSIGLYNVRKRLSLLYGAKGRIWLERKNDVELVVYISF